MRRGAWLATGALHAALLGGLGALGGSPAALWLGIALVGGQLLESAVAPDRPDTPDATTTVLGGLVLGVVVASLGWPGVEWPPGALVVAAGFLLRAWAIRTLGPLFLDGVVRLAEHPRVVRGPYRYVRHPAALGTFVIGLGTAATTGSGWGLGLVVFGLAPALWVRVAAEDALFRGCTEPRHRAA